MQTLRSFRPLRPRLIITSLSLAGLCACDFESALDDAATSPRKGPIEEPIEIEAPIKIPPPIVTPANCITAAHLVLHHNDGTTDISNDLHLGLPKLARPGDLIELDFKLAAACLPKYGSRLTLAAYTMPALDAAKPATAPRAYDVHTSRFGAEGGKLSARLPNCRFDVDLVFGEPLPAPHPDDLAKESQRLIARAQGGNTSCDGHTKLAIDQFDPVEPGWGDAPVAAHFGWQIDAALKAGMQLSCALDFDADGKVDKTISPCPTSTGSLEAATLPFASFVTPGRHRPELVVSDGYRRVWAATTVHANHLEYQANVHFLERAPGFIGAERIKLDKSPYGDIIALTFSSAKAVPALNPDEVIVGTGATTGYMVRAVKVIKDGAKLIVMGDPVGLEQTIASGYFGMRDVQVDTSGAHCVSGDCIGVVTPVPASPALAGAPVHKPLALAAKGLQNDLVGDFGLEFEVPLGDSAKVTLSAGVVIKDFMIDWGFFSIDAVNIELVPTAGVVASFEAAMPTKSFTLGRYFLGAIPTPLPLSIHVSPRFDLDVGLAFDGGLTLTAETRLNKSASGWANSTTPKLEAHANLLDEDDAAEAKITHVLETELSLGLLNGPYIGPSASLAAKVTTDGCEACLTATAGGGVEFGWNIPWDDGNLFEPIVAALGELELVKLCKSIGLPGCEPTPPGGSWGDVHLISLDGLLYDFQAGGEFVLVRATDDRPFTVQTRQEPMKLADFSGTDLSLSINTAVATMVDGHRVGLYTRHTDPVRVDGQAKVLVAGPPLMLGQGSLAVDATGRIYTITYPNGEVLTVTRKLAHGQPRAHFNLELTLLPDRAGAVEGLLGDADGVTTNDIALPGGATLTQPVAFDALYWADNNLADAWRVAPEDSLFDYVGGATPATFRGEPYSLMPVALPPATMPHVQLAQQVCAACPDNLEGTCMTDVGFTGDVSLADACTFVPADDVESEMPAQSSGFAVYPLSGAQMQCDPARNELVFRAPGVQNAHIDFTEYFTFELYHWNEDANDPEASGWVGIDGLFSEHPPAGGWGEDRFVCRPIGAGWGECVMKLRPESSPCLPRSSNKYQWNLISWRTGSYFQLFQDFTGGA
ncbi:MAG: VWD domain-containing protein [Nannocystis sp.]|nr:VWD domain-containing protein [Nannocystis sp.]MBA3549029.1 VWD domain-containing protein [Nannocystis sp.]